MAFLSLQFGRYRFAPNLWPSVAFVLVFPVLLSLGAWQMDRAKQKQNLVERRAETEVAQLLRVDRYTQLGESDRYRPAVVRGRYLREQQWLLDNRTYHGQAGYHVFTPFRVDGDDQATLLVNRGWVSVGASRKYLPRLEVTSEPVTLQGRFDSPASVGLVIGEVPLSSVADRVVVQSLDIAALANEKGIDLLRYALVIDEGQPGGLQYDWSPIPEMGPEKHLGYAVQWFGLAVALLIIYIGVNTRRDRDDGETHANV